MPDLMAITFAQCKSISDPSANVGGYQQYNLHGTDAYPICTCPAYKYAKRTELFNGKPVPPRCKHILQAEKEICGWMQFIDGGDPVRKGSDIYCPICGNEAEWVSIAV